MPTCYKCGRETPNIDPECDACAHGWPPESMPELRLKLHELDWDKAHTIEDYRLIIAHAFPRLAITEEHPHFDMLKKFLK